MFIDATLMRFSQRITEGVGIAKILTSISRGVLMRSILTILLETKNQLEKCYRDYYYFFLEGLGLR